jgi:HEAT repeat protein
MAEEEEKVEEDRENENEATEIPPSLLKGLQSSDASVQARAVAELRHYREPRILDYLISAMKDSDEAVRTEAARGLGNAGVRPETVSQRLNIVTSLEQALRDESARVRISAAEALGQVRDLNSVDPLIRSLDDGERAVRVAVIRALGQINDERALGPLTAVALNDQIDEVRNKAQQAISDIRREHKDNEDTIPSQARSEDERDQKSVDVPEIGGLGGALNDQVASEDQLGFEDYVRAFADLIESPETLLPLTIGIYGPWGMGKSFLLEHIAQELRHRQQERPDSSEVQRVHIVNFNAWEYNATEVIWPVLQEFAG